MVLMLGNAVAFADSGIAVDELIGEVDASYEMEFFIETANESSIVRIQYPRFNSDGYAWLNAVIEQRVLDIAEFIPSDPIAPNEEIVRRAEYNCTVTLVNDNVVSMVFYGSTALDEPYYTRHVDYYGFNIDLTNRQALALTDIYNVDAEFIETVYSLSSAYAQPITKFGDEVFPHMMGLYKYYSRQGNMLTHRPSGVEFYLVDSGIVLLLLSFNTQDLIDPVFEAYLNSEDISSSYIMETSLWNGNQ
jgi:hypothetical protein